MPYSTKRHVIGAATAALLATGLAAAPAQAATTCTWTVQKLPAVAGFTQSFSYGTDHASHLFGALTNDSGITETPAIWSTNPATPPRVLGSAHGSTTRITALNAAGVAVGYYRDSAGHHAVRYVNGAYQDLPVPAGTGQSEAVDVNAHGDIVGNLDGSTIIVWAADRPGYTLMPKAAGDSADATGIDDARDVIGSSGHDDQFTTYIWNASGTTVALPPTRADSWLSANAIRNGRVVGIDSGDAVVWDLSGHVVWRLAGHGAMSINADGLVFGWQSVPDGAVDQLLRNGKVVAPTPTDPYFAGSGGPSAITDSGLLAGRVDDQVATARCH